ncbi:MAG: SPOR domain-containing protein, partial [Henriciella sp.]|nr:SPOR domain-containing protein [Henriciella sp.]
PARGGRFAFTANGPFLVQISAVRSQAAADEAWSRVQSRYPDVFTGAEKVVERADLGANGIFFRVRAGRFDTRSDASEFCESYKRVGGDCIITRETP